MVLTEINPVHVGLLLQCRARPDHLRIDGLWEATRYRAAWAEWWAFSERPSAGLLGGRSRQPSPVVSRHLLHRCLQKLQCKYPMQWHLKDWLRLKLRPRLIHVDPGRFWLQGPPVLARATELPDCEERGSRSRSVAMYAPFAAPVASFDLSTPPI